ncbi:MAG: serine hydrolase [Pseudomonadota bacterium]
MIYRGTMSIRTAMAIVVAGMAWLPPAAAAAQAGDDPYRLALAAGYRAAFTCSATFDAGRTEDRIEADELTRVYDELRAPIAEMRAEIDRDARTVAVTFDEAQPPRIAAWRPRLGCTQLPIGAPTNAIADLPLVDMPGRPDADPLPVALSNDSRLVETMARAFDTETYGAETKTSAALVFADGRIVAERYAQGIDADTPQRTWSVAKSIAGTVLGAAAQRGLIDLDAPVTIPEWQAAADPRQAITTDQLMRMASGLTSDFAGNRTDAIYLGGTSVADSAPGQSLLHPPGTRFRYANNDTLLALYGLRHGMADDAAYRALPFQALLDPLGMNRTFLETDWRGDFIMSSQVWTTARDLVRLGRLYLNDGIHEGERLLPDGFVERVSTPSGPQPDRPWGYGGTFWTAGPETGLPPGTFAAFGNRGQYLVIVPSRDILIVRRGYDPVGENKRFDVTAFARDVLAALD